jgi:hypothetical protein
MVLGIPKFIKGRLMQYASRLRFPKLFAVAGLVFIVDLFFPDTIPFADEILLGLITLLLGGLKKSKGGNRMWRDEG